MLLFSVDSLAMRYFISSCLCIRWGFVLIQLPITCPKISFGAPHSRHVTTMSRAALAKTVRAPKVLVRNCMASVSRDAFKSVESWSHKFPNGFTAKSFTPTPWPSGLLHSSTSLFLRVYLTLSRSSSEGGHDSPIAPAALRKAVCLPASFTEARTVGSPECNISTPPPSNKGDLNLPLEFEEAEAPLSFGHIDKIFCCGDCQVQDLFD